MSKFKPNPNRSAVRRPSPPKAEAVARSSAKSGGDFAAPLSADSGLSENEDELAAGVNGFSFYAVLLFVFFRFSFLHEFIGAKVHANLHLIILIGGASYLCWILSGNAFRGFQERSTWLWLGFICCMAVATVTSFWKSSSLHIFFEYFETAWPVVLVIPAIVKTKPQMQKVINVMGLACITTVLLGSVNDDFTSGRMGVDVASSEIQNPNDFAAHLVLMLPALAFWGFRTGRSIFHKVIAAGCMALCLRQILSSGSRGALLSLAITAVYLLFFGSKQVKAALLIGVPVLALIAIPFVPKTSLSRLATLVSSAAKAKDGEAEDSSEARLQLLKDSLKFTMQRPLSGIGPGEFMDYQAKDAAENGQRGMWHVTHNSYTQVSSECGIPAFVFYVGALGLTLSYLRQVIKTGDPELTPIAATMMVMFIGYGVCIFFLSMAYTVHILILSGLAVTMKLRLAKQINAHKTASLPAAREAVPA